MNILNKLKPTLLVTTIILLPTVSYAENQDQDQGKPTQEELDRATEEALKNKAPLPQYPDMTTN